MSTATAPPSSAAAPTSAAAADPQWSRWAAGALAAHRALALPARRPTSAVAS